MPERVTVRVDDELYGRLTDAAKARGLDLSAVVRQAVSAVLDGSHGTTLTAPPMHDREACARVVLAQCSPGVQARVAGAVGRTGVPLFRLLSVFLQCWADASRTPQAWTPDR